MMRSLFGIIFLIAIVLLVIGLMKPENVLFWSKIKTRKRVIVRYGIIALVALVVTGLVSFGNITVVSKASAVKGSKAFVQANLPKKGAAPSEISKKSIKLTPSALKVKALLDKNFNAVSGLTLTSADQIDAKVDGYSNLEISQARSAIYKKIWRVLRGMRGLKGIKEISLNITYPLPAINNQTDNKSVMMIDYKMTTIEEIDFNHFDPDNVSDAADGYWISPALYGAK